MPAIIHPPPRIGVRLTILPVIPTTAIMPTQKAIISIAVSSERVTVAAPIFAAITITAVTLIAVMSLVTVVIISLAIVASPA